MTVGNFGQFFLPNWPFIIETFDKIPLFRLTDRITVTHKPILIYVMKRKIDFSTLLQFFRDKPPSLPGNPEYNAAFCKILLAASSAEEASIWQLDSRNQLHPVYGTNFTFEEVRKGPGGLLQYYKR